MSSLLKGMNTITQAACQVLRAQSPEEKTRLAHAMAEDWRAGILSAKRSPEDDVPPTQPGCPDAPQLVDMYQVKRRRLGSIEGRCALLHSIAHIEFNAINLAADMVARYAHDTRIEDDQRHAFISDWVGVCNDEARHFNMINTRLEELGSFYGANTAHNGLWEAAISTMNDLAARLVIAPMVLEARGLDVTPNMIQKLKNVNDIESADILKIIYEDEIGHVAAGTNWFSYICTRENREMAPYFKAMVEQHFSGKIKPPFNEEARNLAGLTPSLYNF